MEARPNTAETGAAPNHVMTAPIQSGQACCSLQKTCNGGAFEHPSPTPQYAEQSELPPNPASRDLECAPASTVGSEPMRYEVINNGSRLTPERAPGALTAPIEPQPAGIVPSRAKSVPKLAPGLGQETLPAVTPTPSQPAMPSVISTPTGTQPVAHAVISPAAKIGPPSAASTPAVVPPGPVAVRHHHLLKHTLDEEHRGNNALHHFGTDDLHVAIASIQTMVQRQLQIHFSKVYGVRSNSNNNAWLRKKLLEGTDVVLFP
jgi:hypothetical protein